jgi:hypothetical protein
MAECKVSNKRVKIRSRRCYDFMGNTTFTHRYTHRHASRQTNRHYKQTGEHDNMHTETQADTHTNRQIHQQSDKHVHSHTHICIFLESDEPVGQPYQQISTHTAATQTGTHTHLFFKVTLSYVAPQCHQVFPCCLGVHRGGQSSIGAGHSCSLVVLLLYYRVVLVHFFDGSRK